MATQQHNHQVTTMMIRLALKSELPCTAGESYFGETQKRLGEVQLGMGSKASVKNREKTAAMTKGRTPSGLPQC